MAGINTPGSVVDLPTRAHQISAEARALSGTVEETIRDVEAYLRQRMRTHPYTTLAAATAIGYVLGGGLPSRFTALLLALGTRVAIEAGTRQLTARFADGGAMTSTQR